MVGKPVVAGTRMPVEVLLAKLAANPNLDDLFLDYPELTIDDVTAVLAYASTLGSRPGSRFHRRPSRIVRFLLDESAEARIADFLNRNGHDATRIGWDYPASLSDARVLEIALQENRILVANDKDCGE